MVWKLIFGRIIGFVIPLWLTFCKLLLIYMLTCQRLSVSFCRDPLGPFLKSCVTCILVYWLTWIVTSLACCWVLMKQFGLALVMVCYLLKQLLCFQIMWDKHVSWGKSVRLFGNPSSLPQKKIWFGGFCTVRSPHVSIWGLVIALWSLWFDGWNLYSSFSPMSFCCQNLELVIIYCCITGFILTPVKICCSRWISQVAAKLEILLFLLSSLLSIRTVLHSWKWRAL